MPHTHQSECRLGQLQFLCLLIFISVTYEAIASGSSGQISSTDIAQSVVSSLPKMQGRSATVIANLDLTRPFETQADEQPVDGGALARCFVDESVSHCRYETPKDESDWFSTPIELYSVKVVFAGSDKTLPLLLIKTGSAHGGNGSHAIYERVEQSVRAGTARGQIEPG